MCRNYRVFRITRLCPYLCNHNRPSLPAFESSPLPQHDIGGIDDDEQVGANAAVFRHPPQPRQRLGRSRALHGESPGPATGGDLFQTVEPGDGDAAPAPGGDPGTAAAHGFPLVTRNAGQHPAAGQCGPAREQPAHLHGSHGPVEERLLPNSGRLRVRDTINLRGKIKVVFKMAETFYLDYLSSTQFISSAERPWLILQSL